MIKKMFIKEIRRTLNIFEVSKLSSWKITSYWEKFEITYTNRIYKIFMKKKFSKLNFNHAHLTILKLPNSSLLFFKNYPYDKKLICWYRYPKPLFMKSIQLILNVRIMNYYTWRGLYYSRLPWTKKVGKVSEYV